MSDPSELPDAAIPQLPDDLVPFDPLNPAEVNAVLAGYSGAVAAYGPAAVVIDCSAVVITVSGAMLIPVRLLEALWRCAIVALRDHRAAGDILQRIERSLSLERVHALNRLGYELSARRIAQFAADGRLEGVEALPAAIAADLALSTAAGRAS